VKCIIYFFSFDTYALLPVIKVRFYVKFVDVFQNEIYITHS